MEGHSVRVAIIALVLLAAVGTACQPMSSLSVAAAGPVEDAPAEESIAACEVVLRTKLEQANGADATIEPNEALDQCLMAATALDEAGEWERLARVYTALGILYWEAGDLRAALSCYETRLDLVEWLDDALETARVSANLGMLYLACGEVEKAAEHVARGHLIAVAEGDEELVAQTGAQLVGILGTAEAAIAYLQRVAGLDAPPVAY